ncbi:hypothetical protein MAFF212519_09230 [Clavibacter michiganensis]
MHALLTLAVLRAHEAVRIDFDEPAALSGYYARYLACEAPYERRLTCPGRADK